MIDNDRTIWDSLSDALAKVGVQPVNADPLFVRLVPLAPGITNARHWAETWNNHLSILAVRWLSVSGPAAKYLRAVPEQLEGLLGSQNSSFFVLASRGLVALWREIPRRVEPVVDPSLPLVWPWNPLLPAGGPPPAPPPVAPPVPAPAPVPGNGLVWPWDPTLPAEGPPVSILMPRPLPIGNKFDRLPPRLREVAIGAYIADDEGRLIAAAAELEARGYLKVGDFLRERALLRHTTQSAALGRQTYRIREDGEFPSVFALWFAGEANRWRELLAANPALRAQKGATREEQIVRPWRKGLQVVLPEGWDSRRPQARRTA